MDCSRPSGQEVNIPLGFGNGVLARVDLPLHLVVALQYTCKGDGTRANNFLASLNIITKLTPSNDAKNDLGTS